MFGIEEIGAYIPEKRQDNARKVYRDGQADPAFLRDKVGFVTVSRKAEDEDTADMCRKAFLDLQSRNGGLEPREIECICVCTQNGDYQMPHTAAILQERLGLSASCAAFDISLACSGYVYGLNLMQGFMELNGFSRGILFTCDPYSKILDPEDKNTDLLFGDAAAATLLGPDGRLRLRKSAFGTKGESYEIAIKREGEFLSVDSRGIFAFVMREGMDTIRRCMEMNGVESGDVDIFLFHQATKYVLEQLGRRLRIEKGKIPFRAQEYGNTISSSLPLLLREYLAEESLRRFLLCGFGAGLSASAAVMERV